MYDTKHLISTFITLLFFSAGAQVANADDGLATQLDIPYEIFKLDNGLTTIVYTDHSTPTVFVGLWYGVGSKDEPAGKTGFAHLFEHLMFQSTENHAGEYFSPFADAGATGMNGTTSDDRTNYYATVPTGALDMALWMESDRMTHLLGAVTQEALDEQRGVVQNEKRQKETRAYAQMDSKIREGLYPLDHPYRHTTLGSMDDLNAASVEDVHAWFSKYYGASNVIMVLAGDIDLDTAKEKVALYFNDAPVGVPLAFDKQWIPNLTENRLETMYDRVGQTRIRRVWALPGLNDKDTSLMYLVNQSLAANKNSPLQKKLVDELRLATRVSGRGTSRVISGEFALTIDLRPGVKPEQVLPILDEIIAEYLSTGPDEQIIEDAKLGIEMYILGAMEKSASVARTLVQGLLYSDDPLFVNTELAWLQAADSDELRDIASRWLTRGYYQLTVKPFPAYTAGDSVVDRSEIPAVTADSSVQFPPIETATLKNGMKLVVAHRGNIPLVDVAFRFRTGGLAAPAEAPGMANVMFSLMNSGTQKYDAGELAAAKDKIGLSGIFVPGMEQSSFDYRILRSKLDPSLKLMAEMLQNPSFPEDELSKLKTRLSTWLANIVHSPTENAGQLFDRAIFGADHPLGAQWNDSRVAGLNRSSIESFHADEVAPDNMTVYMIGDISLKDATNSLNNAFAKWTANHRSGWREIGNAQPSNARIILVDFPGASSSTIYAGHAIAPYDAESEMERSIMNSVIGGGFESRLNMNLREDKSWSYGYSSSLDRNASGDQVFVTHGKVQTDKTMESMLEIKHELEDFLSARPATANEVGRVKLKRTRSLPGSFSSNSDFLASIISSASYGLPFNYAETRGDRVATTTLEGVKDRAIATIDTNKLTWLVIGDLEKIEAQVRSLDFGQIEVWDAHGNKLR